MKTYYRIAVKFGDGHEISREIARSTWSGARAALLQLERDNPGNHHSTSVEQIEEGGDQAEELAAESILAGRRSPGDPGPCPEGVDYSD